MADNAGTSEPTVLRFCRALGFRGYHDLKIQLAQDLVPEVKNIHEDVTPEDDAATLVRKVLNTNALAIEDTLDTLDPALVERAIRVLARAKRIEFFGFGGSAAVAMDAYHKFFRLGIPCGWQDDPHMQAMSAALMTARNVVVAISHSGSTKDIVESLEIAKASGRHDDRHRQPPEVAGRHVGGYRAVRPGQRDGLQAGAYVLPYRAPVRHRRPGGGRGPKRSRDFVASVQKTRKALVGKRY